jgi:hypothetical protein
LEIVKAFKNLVSNQRITEEANFRFNQMLSTFCKLICLKEASDDEGAAKIKPVATVVMDIVKQVARQLDMVRIMVSNMAFVRLIVRSIREQDREIVPSDQIIQVLNSILEFGEQIDLTEFFVKTGLIYFILDFIFNKKMTKKNRVEFTRLIMSIHVMTHKIYTNYIPHHFFIEIRKNMQQSNQGEAVESHLFLDFISHFDSTEFENVFLIWNSDLKKGSHDRIKANCQTIWELLQTEDNMDDLDYQIDNSQWFNPLMQNEIIVDDVILRIYNKNPAVFTDKSLYTLVTTVCQTLQGVAQKLFRDQQIIDENHFKIDPKTREITMPEEKKSSFDPAKL